MKYNTIKILTLTLGLLIYGKALALPEYTVRYNQSCQLCHSSPVGGGMRSLYGAQFFSYMDLPVKGLDDFAKLDSISPQLNRHFQFGIDFRSLFYNSDDPFAGNSFLTMEGTLYTTIAPTDRTFVYLSRSLYGSFEAYAQFQGLPYNSVVRAGRFMPAFGWKFADHNSYTRSYLGFGQGGGLDDGVEFGFYPLKWEATASITNGSYSPIDGDRGKVVTVRALRRLILGNFNMTGGVSWRYAEFNLGKGMEFFGLRRFGGAFAGVNRGAFTYLGEADWITDTNKEFAATNLLGFQVRRGVELKIQHDYYDSDVEIGNDFNWRGKLGVDLFLTGYLELSPSFVWERRFGTEYGTGSLQLHVWF